METNVQNVFKAVKHNDIIWMQYMVLHKSLGTKDYVFKFLQHTDGICNICKCDVVLFLYQFFVFLYIVMYFYV